eukprot:COSAG06_NODE_1955_length_7985_cov_18.401598_5_plen_690_part_00
MANSAQTFCEACVPGSAPSADRSMCEQCDGTTHSAFGADCVSCEAPNVVNADHTTCSACAAGTGPNGDRTECVSCEGTSYSTIGQCQDCAAPSIVDSARQTCSACSPGEEPNADRMACVPCTGTAYSSFGVECQNCTSPTSVVNSERTTCTTCPPGEQANADHTQCIKCTGNTFALVGACEECPLGRVANLQRTNCEDVGQVTESLTDLSVVEGIVGGSTSTNLLVKTTLGLNADADLPTYGSAAYDAYVDRFAQDLASALGVDATQLMVGTSKEDDTRRRRIQASSAGEVFVIIDSPTIVRLLHDLTEQLSSPASVLRNSQTAGRTLDPGRTPTFSFVCPSAMMRAAGDPQCTQCAGNQIPNYDQSACTECPPGTMPSADQTTCVCELGSYNLKDLPVIQCFDLDYVDVAPLPASDEGCYSCPTECLNCSTDAITLRTDYRFVTTRASVTQGRHALRCPVTSACSEQVLLPQAVDPTNASSQRELVSSNCSEGFVGTLCAKCKDGYKMTPTQACEPCAVSSSLWNPLLLIPVMLALAYYVFRKFLTFRRERREQKLGAAKRLFDELGKTPTLLRTSTGSSAAELTRPQLIAGMAKHGLSFSEDIAYDLLESIDIDHSGGINAYEFETWMEHDVSRLKVCCSSLRCNIILVDAAADHSRLRHVACSAVCVVGSLQMMMVVGRIIVGLVQ